MELITLLTPCYNAEKCIYRLLDSVLLQTYPHIEMIVIDDGSTDGSAAIIKSYISKFEKKGYSLRYVYQKNGGQSVAIRNGLQLVNGDFLVWPDADDFFSSPKAIEIMAETLRNSSETIALVRCSQNIVDEKDLSMIRIQTNKGQEESASFFEDCLFYKNNFYWGAGAYMVRMDILKGVTNFEIFTTKKAGQNWQLLLPVLYSYRCVSKKDVLYTVLERADSHSRGSFVGYKEELSRICVYEKTVLETLARIKEMPIVIKKTYCKKICLNYLMQKINLAMEYNQNDDYLTFLHTLKIQYPHNYGFKLQGSFLLVRLKMMPLLKFLMHIWGEIKKEMIN